MELGSIGAASLFMRWRQLLVWLVRELRVELLAAVWYARRGLLTVQGSERLRVMHEFVL